MLARAVKRAKDDSNGMRIAAVTVLTSLDDRDLARMGTAGDVLTHAKRLARMAYDEGVRAFVCSPREVAAIRAELGADATLITPGVRATAGGDNQKRVATAAQARADGADWLVVGRPIRDAADPLAAAVALRDEALRGRPREPSHLWAAARPRGRARARAGAREGPRRARRGRRGAARRAGALRVGPRRPGRARDARGARIGSRAARAIKARSRTPRSCGSSR